jgi:hypothetical protein
VSPVEERINRDGSTLPEPPSLPPPSRRQTTGALQTSKGRLTVPGYAYLDGRDLEALPPLTLRQVRLWDSPRRRKPICQVTHGSRVEVAEASFAVEEDRYYFRVASQDCAGWVPEVFISPEFNERVGDWQ